WHRLAEAKHFDERLSVISDALPVISNPPCTRTEMLSSYFLSDNTEHFQSVDQLAKEICYSTRQLNRVIQNLFGVSAEELTTYKKFIEAVKLVHINTGSLTNVAYSAGFYDQAHFCRVFKSYSGMTANQYRKQKSDLPFHIFSN
ncbi:MAG TPA: helix-turn-helix domain-containing protein, partial [Chitinophagaceae bacterium]